MHTRFKKAFNLLIFSFVLALSNYSHSKKPLKESSDTTTVSWDTLAGLDTKSGKANEGLLSLHGRIVKVPGFIVPLDFSEAREVKEFLVTPAYPGCIHVPPPSPNQTVHVKMADGKKAKMTWGPIWITGKLNIIKKKKTSFGDASYEISGITLEDYDMAKGGDRLVDQVITGVPSAPPTPQAVPIPVPTKTTDKPKAI